MSDFNLNMATVFDTIDEAEWTAFINAGNPTETSDLDSMDFPATTNTPSLVNGQVQLQSVAQPASSSTDPMVTAIQDIVQQAQQFAGTNSNDLSDFDFGNPPNDSSIDWIDEPQSPPPQLPSPPKSTPDKMTEHNTAPTAATMQASEAIQSVTIAPTQTTNITDANVNVSEAPTISQELVSTQTADTAQHNTAASQSLIPAQSSTPYQTSTELPNLTASHTPQMPTPPTPTNPQTLKIHQLQSQLHGPQTVGLVHSTPTMPPVSTATSPVQMIGNPSPLFEINGQQQELDKQWQAHLQLQQELAYQQQLQQLQAVNSAKIACAELKKISAVTHNLYQTHGRRLQHRITTKEQRNREITALQQQIKKLQQETAREDYDSQQHERVIGHYQRRAIETENHLTGARFTITKAQNWVTNFDQFTDYSALPVPDTAWSKQWKLHQAQRAQQNNQAQGVNMISSSNHSNISPSNSDTKGPNQQSFGVGQGMNNIHNSNGMSAFNGLQNSGTMQSVNGMRRSLGPQSLDGAHDFGMMQGMSGRQNVMPHGNRFHNGNVRQNTNANFNIQPGMSTQMAPPANMMPTNPQQDMFNPNQIMMQQQPTTFNGAMQMNVQPQPYLQGNTIAPLPRQQRNGSAMNAMCRLNTNGNGRLGDPIDLISPNGQYSQATSMSHQYNPAAPTSNPRTDVGSPSTPANPSAPIPAKKMSSNKRSHMSMVSNDPTAQVSASPKKRQKKSVAKASPSNAGLASSPAQKTVQQAVTKGNDPKYVAEYQAQLSAMNETLKAGIASPQVQQVDRRMPISKPRTPANGVKEAQNVVKTLFPGAMMNGKAAPASQVPRGLALPPTPQLRQNPQGTKPPQAHRTPQASQGPQSPQGPEDYPLPSNPKARQIFLDADKAQEERERSNEEYAFIFGTEIEQMDADAAARAERDKPVAVNGMVPASSIPGSAARDYWLRESHEIG